VEKNDPARLVGKPAALAVWAANIAEAVLASGDRLVATARDPRRLNDLVEKYGDQIRTAPSTCQTRTQQRASVKVAVDAFGDWMSS